MPYLPTPLRCPWYLPEGHSQTIWPALRRQVTAPVAPRLERIDTPDGDFLDLDWYHTGNPAHTLVVLCHGFEGNSRSSYMLGMVRALLAPGIDCLAWNFRSCSAELNRLPIFYHSGATYDLHTVMTHALAGNAYQRVYLVGFSLGGNLVLKYTGEYSKGLWRLSPPLAGTLAVSVPCDLRNSAVRIESGLGRIYAQRFLASLRRKVQAKAAALPHAGLNLEKLKQATTLRLFDRYFTAPLHGYRDEEDYYRQNSSLYWLEHIAVPTTLVSAANDPMLSASSHPVALSRHHANLAFVQTQQGGHCGFPEAGIGSGATLPERLAQQMVG